MHRSHWSLTIEQPDRRKAEGIHKLKAATERFFKNTYVSEWYGITNPTSYLHYYWDMVSNIYIVSNSSRAAGIAAGKNTLEYSKVFLGETPDDPADGYFPSFSLQI